jgi:hypothetical protein
MFQMKYRQENSLWIASSISNDIENCLFAE